ncbi:alpha-(1-_3)-arabinofuranosyltransferase [Nocardioides psychrotolerans]|uniref:Arabinofuranan 3-O-arabinosyltransferase n=1 Tax=Nocardioides psychrotolerans TaxID=1005945 RepID=A0A1I3FMH1_9ACTN|nr:alpha-(1->3)-arabinofuranosyltransferase family protein [Nocardioides psychrotolerans]GEP37216.1 alpha-(1->3)-arabinofuranosyltransferase [Nocardioides psychrotolerans]SFI12465.1 arabinofuranan 3-O-arabinosyltransferase [Nocardioides psychrotolerans]
MTADALGRTRFRLRRLAACALLVGLAMIQSPGQLVSDTKFDLAVAPAGFLARTLHLWDSVGALGQLQNQAYGYLWPMGPFFLAGSALDFEPWVVQRLWLALVLCVAFLGAATLSRLLGVRSDLACLLAGFAYALSPRMLTTLGPISIEAWPSALAPWVLVPLVIGSQRGSARRAAALSALAVAMVGGVNAAATFAVLPLGVLWLLTRSPGQRRRTMMVWWPVFTALGTLWWLVPLALMGAYSPPFLDFIESASNTTFPTSLFDALRGTSNWVPYIDTSSRAGNDLIRDYVLIINSGVVLFLGFVGLLWKGNPHRLFLASGLLLGLLMVTMGHLGNVQGWAAVDLHSLLDGVLAPLRNVHKFDPLIRLPLVLGLAWLVGALVEDLAERRSRPDSEDRVEASVRRVNTRAVLVTAVVAVLGAALPVAVGRVTPTGGVLAVPDYWTEASAWLDAEQSTALLVPGSSFGTYVWGTPRDEPLQWFDAADWTVRNAVPLTPAGNIRMLDAIEARFAQGEGSPGLASYLRRAGITHLVVRNDLQRSGDVPDPVLVHQAIEDSPGLTAVRTFGPEVGGEARLEGRDGSRILVNAGWQNSYRAIEVFEVEGAASLAVGSTEPPVVVGGPEDLLDLSDLGLLGDEPTILAPDVVAAPPPGSELVLTDGLQAVERNFGRVHDGASATLVPGETRRLGNPTRDYLIDTDDRWSTFARLDGVASVEASSSMSDSTAIGPVQRGQLPYAALDGDASTAWVGNFTAEAAWWQVDFDRPRDLATITVTAGPDEREVVEVSTPGSVLGPFAVPRGATRTVTVDEPDATWLRVDDVSGRPGNRLALAEVDVPGLQVTRSLVLPTLPEAWGSPDTIVLRAIDDARRGCAVVDRAVRCVEGRDVAPEEPAGMRRDITLPQPTTYDGRLTVRARPGSSTTRLMQQGLPIGVSASSTGNPDLRASIVAAVDGDRSTTWTAVLADIDPIIRMNWLERQTITGLDLSVAPDTAARVPTELTLTWPGGSREVSVDDDGEVSFPAIRVDQLTLAVREAEPASSLDFASNGSQIPVGITELDVRGLSYLPLVLPEEPRAYACGQGPTIDTGRQAIPTSVIASPRELFEGGALEARLCGSGEVALPEGPGQVAIEATDAFTPVSLVLTDGVDQVGSAEPVINSRTSPAHLELLPGGTDTLLTVRENTNPGWVATRGGRELTPVVVDGWQQGYWLPEVGSRETVTMDFAPDTLYRGALVAGLLGLLALFALCCVPRRRWTDTLGAPLGAARLPAAALAAFAVLGGGLLAGSLGAGLAAVGFVVAAILRRRSPDSAPWLLAAVVLPAAGAFALRPWGGATGWAGTFEWPHYLVVVVCAVLFGWLVEERPQGGRRPPRRIPGLSTTR